MKKHIILNLNRNQYLKPEVFFEASTMRGLVDSAEGVMLGLACLLADNFELGGCPINGTSPVLGSWAGQRICLVDDQMLTPPEKEGALAHANPKSPLWYEQTLANGEDISAAVVHGATAVRSSKLQQGAVRRAARAGAPELGQPFAIVNLDKREALHTQRFGDHSEFLEFACASNGTLAALALLLAPTTDGNISWANNRLVVAGDYGPSLATWGLKGAKRNLFHLADYEFKSTSLQEVQELAQAAGVADALRLKTSSHLHSKT